MLQIALSNLSQFVGKEVGVSGWLTVDQSRIDQFAECTGDRQWIHIDVERAKRESPYRSPIAHGYLALALMGSLQTEIGALAEGFNVILIGLDKIRFLAPVKAGARVRLRAILMEIEQRNRSVVLKTNNTLEIEGSNKPALIAESRTLLTRPKGA
jgi:acyl dehydratase